MGDRISGKIALVTGAGSGIGRAVAERFAAEGAIVVCCDVSAPAASEVAVAIGGRARGVTLDVRDAIAVDAVVDSIVRDEGRLDILMNAAGVLAFGSVATTDDATWQRVIGVNLTGTFTTCRAAVRAMRLTGGGAIVNISSSTGGFDVGSEIAAYVASKAGVVMLTKSIAVDHARDGIRANVIAPGPVDTPMLGGVMDHAQMQAFGESLPIGRLGRASTLAGRAPLGAPRSSPN